MDSSVILMYIGCSLSIMGSSIMIIMYINIGLKNNFSLRMICCMAISDFVFSTSNLAFHHAKKKQDWICEMQATLLQFSELSSYTFCFLLMLCIFLSIIKNRQNLQVYNVKFFIFGFGVPFFISLIPLIGDHYGDLGYACGFKFENTESQSDKDWTITEAIIFFYFPLWGFNIANIFLIYQVVMFFRQLTIRQNSIDKEALQQQLQEIPQSKELQISYIIIRNMLAYPIIQIICWLPQTINRIAILSGANSNFMGNYVFVFPDFIGLLNSIVYVVNHIYFKEWQENIKNDQIQQQMIQLKQQKIKTNFESFMTSSFVESVGSFDLMNMDV